MSLAIGVDLGIAGIGGSAPPPPAVTGTIAGVSQRSSGSATATVIVTGAIAGTSQRSSGLVAALVTKLVTGTIAGTAKRSSGSITGTVASFVPSDISGLVGWYSADQIAGAQGDPISSWSDLSASGATATQISIPNQPALQSPDARFNGHNSALFSQDKAMVTSPAIDLSAGMTVVSVFNYIAPINYNGLFRYELTAATDTSGGIVMYGAANGSLNFGQATFGWYWNGAAGAIVANTSYIAAAIVSGSSAYKIRLNGSDVTAGGSATGSTTSLPGSSRPLFLGCGVGVPGVTLHFGMNGYLAEQLVYNSALSPTDIGKVETYLNAKYAVY